MGFDCGSKPTGHPCSDGIQPTTEGRPIANHRCSPNQDQESGLEGVVGICRVAQDGQANGPDHWTVPANESRECNFVAGCKKGRDQFPIGPVVQPESGRRQNRTNQ